MTNKQKESIAITVQIITSIVSIATVIISIILLYNHQLELNDKEPFLSPDEAQKITTFNRFLVVFVLIIFLIINYFLYYISKEEGENLKAYKLQIAASYLSVAAALIGLYVVLKNPNGENIADIENPIF